MRKNPDYFLLGIVVVLTALSILMVFSTTAIYSMEYYGDSKVLIVHQTEDDYGLAYIGCRFEELSCKNINTILKYLKERKKQHND